MNRPFTAPTDNCTDPAITSIPIQQIQKPRSAAAGRRLIIEILRYHAGYSVDAGECAPHFFNRGSKAEDDHLIGAIKTSLAKCGLEDGLDYKVEPGSVYTISFLNLDYWKNMDVGKAHEIIHRSPASASQPAR